MQAQRIVLHINEDGNRVVYGLKTIQATGTGNINNTGQTRERTRFHGLTPGVDRGWDSCASIARKEEIDEN